MNTITENPTYKLELASSPHVHSRWNTKQAMWMVVFALIPSLISAVIFFGFYQLIVVGVSLFFCIATEYAIKRIRKRKPTLMDGSAVITGLLLGLILPPNFNLAFVAVSFDIPLFCKKLIACSPNGDVSIFFATDTISTFL